MVITEAAVDLRYPIGKYVVQDASTQQCLGEWIDQLASAPSLLRAAVAGLDEDQLQTPYREGGWTVHVLVHHIADSHSNGFARFKLGLTEEDPLIKPYDQNAWALLADSRTTPVNVSLTLLEMLHTRWVALLAAMTEQQWARTIQHPESGAFRLDQLLGLYAWHGRHHTAQITRLREQNGW